MTDPRTDTAKAAHKQALAAVRDALEGNDVAAARATLRRAARETDAHTEFSALCRARRRIERAAEPVSDDGALRVAVVSNASTDFLLDPLSLAIEAEGLECSVEAAPYGTASAELLDPAGFIAQQQPNVLLVALSPLHQIEFPAVGEADEDVEVRARSLARHWIDACTRAHEHAGCDVLITNFHALPHRAHGNLEANAAWAPNAFLQRVNAILGNEAPAAVHVLDTAGLAAALGTRAFVDLRLWHHAKQPIAFDSVVPFVRQVARTLAALRGRGAKVLALDLDNTLWGGVIGDDGLAGIALGQGSAEAEAFVAFQQHARQLRERGILLAVCSKNEHENAIEPFEKHPDSVLKLSDFAAFRANWDPKPDNLRSIARELNLGLDAFVFADDNPMECEYVRSELPEVTVVELSGDPADFPARLDACGRFEAVTLSDEDRARTEQYRGNAKRVELEATSGSLDEFLSGLEQVARIGPFAPVDFPRITQLVNKSNQFNLTTQRLDASEVEQWANDSERVTCSTRLRDRLGDNGLIGVTAARVDGDALDIDQWLMSCRVLRRRVEELVCDHLAAEAQRRGLRWLRGRHIPTAKNALVRDHYAQLGFSETPPEPGDPEGTTRWQRDLADYVPFAPPIRVEEPPDAS